MLLVLCRGVSLFRRWLSTKGQGGPQYADAGRVEDFRDSMRRLDRRALLDRHAQHTAHCSTCSKVGCHSCCAAPSACSLGCCWACTTFKGIGEAAWWVHPWPLIGSARRCQSMLCYLLVATSHRQAAAWCAVALCRQGCDACNSLFGCMSLHLQGASWSVAGPRPPQSMPTADEQPSAVPPCHPQVTSESFWPPMPCQNWWQAPRWHQLA